MTKFHIVGSLYNIEFLFLAQLVACAALQSHGMSKWEVVRIILWKKYKVEAIPLKAWTGPEGSRSLRIPDFKTLGT